jgi:formylglycine-generating enzyme required for sulfatase activity
MLRSMFALSIIFLAALVAGGVEDRSSRPGMRPVRIGEGETLLVSTYEVSIASWRRCAMDGACADLPQAHARNTTFPMTGVSWLDVKDYIDWTNARSGGGLRLPTLAEWRAIDRSLAHTPAKPLFADPRLSWAANYERAAVPAGPVRASGSFTTTRDGIADLDGNVWEWTSSCYKPDSGLTPAVCPAFVAAGAHEAVVSIFVRDPASGGCATGTPPTHLGFRLVADP